MSFTKLEKLTKKQLLEVADFFSTYVDKEKPKTVVLQDLKDAGVTDDDYENFVVESEVEKAQVAAEAAGVEDASSKIVEKPDKVLLFMSRQNPTFEVRGARFTKQHPFALMEAEDAEFVVSHLEGFRPATPKELSDFYG